MAAGVEFSRKRKLSDYQRAEAIKRRTAGEMLADIARLVLVTSHATQHSGQSTKCKMFEWPFRC
jgi:hypothetical protein